MSCYCMCANDCAAVCMCLNVNMRTSERKHVYLLGVFMSVCCAESDSAGCGLGIR